MDSKAEYFRALIVMVFEAIGYKMVEKGGQNIRTKDGRGENGQKKVAEQKIAEKDGKKLSR